MSVRPSSNSNVPAPEPRSAPRASTILLVDDDARLSMILQNYLELNNFSVRSAASGEEALRLCGERLPDMILLDVRMPGIGGLETLRRIRQGYAGIPIVVITYVDEEGVRAEAAALGVREYLLKPVNFEDLKVLLHDVLPR